MDRFGDLIEGAPGSDAPLLLVNLGPTMLVNRGFDSNRKCFIEYNRLTHHTNLDTYERIIPGDVKKDAAIVAAAVWHAANREQMIPRFTKETMPAPVEPR